MNKVLTISIAAYNVEQYIDHCLTSLLVKELLDKIEVIIVNDGSSDKTEEVAKKYVDQYPETFILVNKTNGGYGSTINTSIKAATGKYFKQLDGDDWFNTVNLNEYIDFLEGCDSDLVLTDYMEVYESSSSSKLNRLQYKARQVFDISDIMTMGMHSLSVKTSLIREINITEKCFYTDGEFVLKCYTQCSNFIYLPVCVYMYRLGRNGQSVTPPMYYKHINEHRIISELLYSLYKNYDILSHLREEIMNYFITHISIMLLNKPTKQNKKDFIDFCELSAAYFSDIGSHLRGASKLVFKHPIFYYLICKMKRKKYSIKS